MTQHASTVEESILRDIRITTQRMHRILIFIRYEADRAIEALAAGEPMADTITGTQPIGLQEPADLTHLAGRLDALAEAAARIGIDRARLADAYRVA